MKIRKEIEELLKEYPDCLGRLHIAMDMSSHMMKQKRT